MTDGIPSRLDLYALGRDYVVTRAKKINPTEVDVEGSNVNIFVGATSFMAYAVLSHALDAAKNLTLGGAEDDKLYRLMMDRYQLPQKGATAAIVRIDIWRTTTTAGAGALPIGTVINSIGSGIQYTTLEVANFGAGTLQVSSILARAVQAGKAFQVGANTLRLFDKPQTLFDKTLQVNNPQPAAGGENVEDEELYRERGQKFWLAARRGVVGAIEFGALATDGVVSAYAREVTDSGNPARVVELFIADSSGVANSALADRVRETLLEYRAGGIQVIINTSQPVIQNIALRLRFRAGTNDTSGLSETIANAVVEFVNSLPVNAPLLLNDLGALLARYSDSGLLLYRDTVSEPAGDVFPELSTTIRTRRENVTIL
jgi:hypothetical protein